MNKRTVPRVSYLLVKGRSEQVPLAENSVSLSIVTPPYCGASRIPQKDCPARDAEQYNLFLSRVLKEATRITKPLGSILLHTNVPPVRRIRGVPQIEFQIFRRKRRPGRRTLKWVRSEKFTTPYAHVKGIKWTALPIWLYRDLIHLYSKPGERIAHLFSGSANSAIAALELSRLPILVDLHHHRQVQRRLRGPKVQTTK